MTIQLPQKLENILKTQAAIQGQTAEDYLRELLERELAPILEIKQPVRPFKNSYGSLSKYGPAPTDDEMDQNRREMFKNFGDEL